MPRGAAPPLLLAVLLLSLATRPTTGVAVLLYSLPESIQLDNASIVRVNPSGPTIYDTTLIDVWRLGAGAMHNKVSGWDVDAYTGAGLPASAARALTPLAPGSTAVQFANGTFGAHLNLLTNPLQPGATLGTITIENNFGTPAAPWSGLDGVVACSVDYTVPTAHRTGVAVYTSWTLGIAHASDFIWYETTLFDLDRPLGGDELWLDTISGSIIVHAPLTSAPSAFHTLAPGSALASTTPWAGWRRFAFSISAAQVAGALHAANAKFNRTLDTDPAHWRLVHMNVEVEGTPGDVRAGHALRDMRIEALSGGGAASVAAAAAVSGGVHAT